MSRLALVTGGAGFIGSYIVDRLVREGWGVRVIDNLSSGSTQNLEGVRGQVELLEADIRDDSACRRACVGVDTVFHLAALVSVVESVNDPRTSHEVNLGGTINLLQSARDCEVRRFVFSSSAAVYGNTERVPTSEDEPIDPQSPYACDKAAGEIYCRSFSRLYGFESVILRYFNVFGPRQRASSGYAAVIPSFIEAARTQRSPIIYGDGLQTRDFVYVESVAEANVRAAMAPNAAGEVINVAGGEQTSVLHLLHTICQAAGSNSQPQFLPERSGEVRHSRAEVSKANALLGPQTPYSLEEAIRKTVAASIPVLVS